MLNGPIGESTFVFIFAGQQIDRFFQGSLRLLQLLIMIPVYAQHIKHSNATVLLYPKQSLFC